MRYTSVLMFTGVLLAAGGTPAMAGPIYFTDRTAFDAAAGALNFESFETSRQGASVTYGDVTFTESAGVNFFTNTAINNHFTSGTTDGLSSIWFDDNGSSIATLTFAGAVNAMGLDLTTSRNSRVTIGGGSILLLANMPSFFGVIDYTGTFSSLTFDASGRLLMGFDALSFGMAGQSFDMAGVDAPSSGLASVPEPASVLLLGLGLAVAASRRLRGRSRA